MSADQQRVDDLVQAMGTLNGTVSHLHDGVAELKDGMTELRGAMTVLSRHSIALERQAEDHGQTRAELTRHDARITAVETKLAAELPPLVEARTYAVRGVLFVLTAVGVALLALVIKR